MTAFSWALITACIWSIVPIIEKVGLSKTPALIGLFYRCLGVLLGLAFLIVFKFTDIKSSVIKPPSGWYLLILSGFLASVVAQLSFYNALRIGEVSKVTPIAAMYPFVTFILGVILLHEIITMPKVIGIIFIVIGVILLK